MRKRRSPALDHTLEYLLGFNGRVHLLAGGYWIKFEITQDKSTRERPHGLRYSFTLHEPRNHRIVGFDNAHAVPPLGRNARRATVYDHWHRTEDDKGRPYTFVDAETLVTDFFTAVRKELDRRGISFEVVGERSTSIEP